MIQIDRIRLTAVAKNQLITLKRRTGINHYNVLCRYAFCLSLANDTTPPLESFNFNGGIDIEWRIFTGGNEMLYLNLLMLRCEYDGVDKTEEAIKLKLYNHIHRGLSFMMSLNEYDLMKKYFKIGNS